VLETPLEGYVLSFGESWESQRRMEWLLNGLKKLAMEVKLYYGKVKGTKAGLNSCSCRRD